MAEPGPYTVIRTALGAGTWGSLALALVTRDARWWVASGVFGTLWWLADVITNWLLVPAGEFVASLFSGDVNLPPARRTSVADLMQLLEANLENDAPRSVQIQSALQLADLYRVVQDDPLRARAILAMVRSRFPDAPELRDPGGAPADPPNPGRPEAGK